ncbi:Protein VAC14-like protein [Forsythia ovata]|uniref:Protein VAC14-like protein n=1 Tax=Forsythia ovata TaxID=205694 RepID=A0ABD1T9R7_9LAMI
MADASSVIPTTVLHNLSDKLYEKHKNAVLEVEGIVKHLALAGDHDKITSVINLLATEFTHSPLANNRKGGLIGLAAATVGLSSEAAQPLEDMRGNFIVLFNQIFEALCKLSADSDPNVQSAAYLLDKLVKYIVTEGDQFRSLRVGQARHWSWQNGSYRNKLCVHGKRANTST